MTTPNYAEYKTNYKRGWLRDTYVLLHIPRATAFYGMMVMGVFTSQHIHIWPTILAFTALFFGLQISAYAIDELRGRKCNTSFTNKELKIRGVFGLCMYLGVGTFLTLTTTIYFLPLMLFGLFGIVGYNFNESHGTLGSLHSRVFFGVIWGAFPLLSMNYFETLSWPHLSVVVLALFTIPFSVLHISTYGFWRCKSYGCLDLKRAQERGHDSFEGQCHGQLCQIRRFSIPKEVHRLAKMLANLQVVMLYLIVIFVVVNHYGI